MGIAGVSQSNEPGVSGWRSPSSRPFFHSCQYKPTLELGLDDDGVGNGALSGSVGWTVD